VKRFHLVSIIAIIFIYLFAAVLFYAAFFGESPHEDDVFETISWAVMAAFTLVVAIIATYRHIIVLKQINKLPPEDLVWDKETLVKEDIIYRILKLENPNVDFNPKNITLNSLNEQVENYKIKERFGNRSVQELLAYKESLIK